MNSKRKYIPIFCAGTVGALSWCGLIYTLPLSVLVFYFWGRAETRLISYGTIASYYFCALHQLPLAAYGYYDSVLVACLLWFSVSLIVPLVYATLWSKNRFARAVSVPFILTLITLPPFGIIGLVNPLSGAGILLNGWGWYGIGAMTLYSMLLASFNGSRLIIPFLIIVFSYPLLKVEEGEATVPYWHGVNTSFNYDTNSSVITENFFRQANLAKGIIKENITKAVFPESSIGVWSDLSESLLKTILLHHEVDVLFGGTKINTDSFDNVIIRYKSNEDTKTVYVQRQPVPFSMWRPFFQNKFNAHWFENPIVTLDKERVSFLVCYEQMLTWPVLHSMLHNPSAIFATANLHWARGTNLAVIHKNVLYSWGKLFAVPIVISFNE